MIRVENLVKRFRGHEALRGLNVNVPEGSAYAPIVSAKGPIRKLAADHVEQLSGN